jgi:hypothetical protein
VFRTIIAAPFCLLLKQLAKWMLPIQFLNNFSDARELTLQKSISTWQPQQNK